ncbi:MAG TPA: hypothetical protein VM871_05520 [Flavisolibacter sp.]|nr:hypothetical protein [Flavisolibacter sp.]
MQGSKIRLSPAESELFCSAEMILTKNSILQKTTDLLLSVQEQLCTESPPTIRHTSPPPKISKGENYLGLPYVVLDYPRIAKGNDLFFVRSLFWWGNFYSSTLQLAGKFKKDGAHDLEAAYDVLAVKNYFVGINSNPWVHHFKEDNYTAICNLSPKAFAAILEERTHIKIAAQWPLSEWDLAANNLKDSWRILTGLVT